MRDPVSTAITIGTVLAVAAVVAVPAVVASPAAASAPASAGSGQTADAVSVSRLAASGADDGATENATTGPGGVESTAGDRDRPRTAATVARTDDAIRYDLSLSSPSGVEHLWVVVRGPVEVTDLEGFERSSVDGLSRFRWTGAQTNRLSIVVPARDGEPVGLESARNDSAANGSAGIDSAANGSTANGSTAAESGDIERTATDDWAFGRVPFVEVQWVAGEEIERSWPLLEREGLLADGEGGDEPGVFGDRYALAGDADVVRRWTATGRVDVVVPAGVQTSERPRAIADAIARASRQLDVGDRGDDVLAFAVPDPVRAGGESIPARDEFWVHADSRLDSPENVWLHEYVHTRQSFALAQDMRWFREASAEYYAARLSREQGTIDRGALRSHIDGPASTATLAAPETWSSRFVPHRKGARVLAVLDRRIEERTYGHRSLEDVFRRLNRRDGRVTYDVFAQTVAEVTGESMDDWLDSHVAGDEPVAGQYGTDSALAGVGLSRVDLRGGGAGGSFFVVALGFSVVAAAPLYGVLRRFERAERSNADLRHRNPAGRQ